MDPGDVPRELQGLTQVCMLARLAVFVLFLFFVFVFFVCSCVIPLVYALQNALCWWQIEQMLIARAQPLMRLYVRSGGSAAFSGHVINLPHDIQGLADELPNTPANLPIVVVRKTTQDVAHGTTSTREFRARRQRVLDALQWLVANNPLYRDVRISLHAAQSLPEDADIPISDFASHELSADSERDPTHHSPDPRPASEHKNQDDADTDAVVDADADVDAARANNHRESFVPVAGRLPVERDRIAGVLNQHPHHPYHPHHAAAQIAWPRQGSNAIDEFSTSCLASLCFPTLFPRAEGDFTNLARRTRVKENEGLHFSPQLPGSPICATLPLRILVCEPALASPSLILSSVFSSARVLM
jgi:hypothetical protein